VSIAAVVLAAGAGSRFSSTANKLRAELDSQPVLLWSVDAARGAGFDEVIVVVGDDAFDDILTNDVHVLHAPQWMDGQSHSLQVAVSYAREKGHDAIVVGLGDQPLVGQSTWNALRMADASGIAVATYAGLRRPPTRLAASLWDSLPTQGDEGARVLIRSSPELVSEVASAGSPLDVDTDDALDAVRGRHIDRLAVTALLGREPMGPFEVVVRTNAGDPVVLKNYPLLANGRPMPTLYWLCGERESMLVGRLEAMKGVRRAEADLGLDVINAAHERYREERDAILNAATSQPAHRPTGGVGGTRNGVKCLHAHYGYWLAGGDDPVGQWVADHLHEVDSSTWPAA
jgi:CTP:molybdopterin cytidylyltransferase MocA